MIPIRSKFIFSIVVLIACFQNSASAQGLKTIRHDYDESWRITRNLAIAIFRPEKPAVQNFLIASATIALSAIVLDSEINNFALHNQNDRADYLFRIDRYYGSRKYTPAALMALYLGGFISGNESLRLAGLKALQAMALTGLIASGVKEVAGRSRPYLNEGAFFFKPFAFEESRRSFYSGHSAITFSISTVMAHQIDHFLWKSFWYGAAGLVTAARIYHNDHWFSDALAGSLVGYGIGNFITHQGEGGYSEEITHAPTLRFNLARGELGLCFSFAVR